ncbi:MAG TPA: hypothetical protein VF143_01890 [Candidatus Nanopelagicales bacterium]
MTAQIAAELLKLRTTRLLLLTTCVAVGFAALVPALGTWDPEGFGVAPLTSASLTDMMRAPAHVVAGAALVLGIVAATGEHAHRTILTTRLVQPDPIRVLAAKATALGIVGAGLAALAEATAAVVGTIGLARHGLGAHPLGDGRPGVALTVILLAAAFAALGTALGSIVRNTALAVGAALVWALLIEEALPGLTGDPDLGRWLPAGTIDQLVTLQPAGPSPAAAALALIGYTAAAMLLATLSDTRRDP